MLPGAAPLAVLPLAVPEPSWSTADPLAGLLADPDFAPIFVMRAWPQSLATLDSDIPYPFATQAFGVLDAGDQAGSAILGVATHDFATEPGDSLPNRIFPPRLRLPLQFESSIPTPGNEGAAAASWGALRIENGDGELDGWLDYSWTGRTFELLMGGTVAAGRAAERRLRYDEMGVLWRGAIAAVSGDEREIVLSIRDPLALLQRPLQARLYAGTGGMEGSPEVEGRQKPLCFGPCRQVAPVQIDGPGWVFQVHDGRIDAVLAVRHKGVSLAAAGDVADLSLADVWAWTPVSGQYVTDLANGLVRLGAKADGVVTVDLRGDAEGGYVDTAAPIVRRLATRYGGMADPAELDPVAFESVGFAAPQTVHLVVTDATTTLAAVQSVMASVDGWAVADRLGRLTIGIWSDPETETATATLDDERLASRSVSWEQPAEPAWRVRIGYRRMNTLQSADALAGSVSEADRALWGEEYRWAVASDADVRALHSLAREIERPTLLDDAAEAAAEAARIAAYAGRMPRLHTVEAAGALGRYRTGQVVELRRARFGLAGGRRARVVGLVERPGGVATRLTLWCKA